MRTLAAIVRVLLLVLSAAAFVAFWFVFQGYGLFAAPLGVIGVILLCAFFLSRRSAPTTILRWLLLVLIVAAIVAFWFKWGHGSLAALLAVIGVVFLCAFFLSRRSRESI